VRTFLVQAADTGNALAISQQTGLLSNDALIVAVMQSNGLTNLASHDAVLAGCLGWHGMRLLESIRGGRRSFKAWLTYVASPRDQPRGSR
jgi:hypothetical protein